MLIRGGDEQISERNVNARFFLKPAGHTRNPPYYRGKFYLMFLLIASITELLFNIIVQFA